jgi:type I restriction enzyme, S subunit
MPGVSRLDLTTVRHISEDEYPRWTKRVTPEQGDIVFTYEATLHRYGVIPRGFRGCLGRRTALLRPKSGRIDSTFLLPMLRSSSWINYMESKKLHGSTVDRISIKKFPDFEMLLPSNVVVEQFRKIAAPTIALSERLQEQNQALRAARDLLLPRLMNGSIAV